MEGGVWDSTIKTFLIASSNPSYDTALFKSFYENASELGLTKNSDGYYG